MNKVHKRSYTCESACIAAFDSLHRKPQAIGLHAVDTSIYKGLHIGPCYPIPNHATRIEVSSSAHRLTSHIVFQKSVCRVCYSTRVFKGNQCTTPISQEFSRIPVRSRDDGLPSAKGVCKCSRYGLRFESIGRYVNVGRSHQRSHFLLTYKAVIEDYVLLDSKFLRQGLQLKPVLITFGDPDMRVSGAC